jgi:hypothetical protein
MVAPSRFQPRRSIRGNVLKVISQCELDDRPARRAAAGVQFSVSGWPRPTGGPYMTALIVEMNLLLFIDGLAGSACDV